MEVSTIELDLSPEIQDWLYKEMNKIAREFCEEASYTIFKEAYEDRRDVQDGATCLGHAILNSIFVNAILEGLKSEGFLED